MGLRKQQVWTFWAKATIWVPNGVVWLASPIPSYSIFSSGLHAKLQPKFGIVRNIIGLGFEACEIRKHISRGVSLLQSALYGSLNVHWNEWVLGSPVFVWVDSSPPFLSKRFIIILQPKKVGLIFIIEPGVFVCMSERERTFSSTLSHAVLHIHRAVPY